MKRYFDVEGPLEYPEPCDKPDTYNQDLKDDEGHTFCNNDINDYGDFVRAYRTLEDAKTGALARCGWQGLNRETIIKEQKK